jgi:hypothetical protein
MKGIHWEQAKAQLRCLVAIDGSVSSGANKTGEFRFQIVSRAVEKFIKEFEDEGLNE